jgi:hypothetical protein
MPVKLLRLGFTETTLLFIYWCNINKNLKFKDMKNTFTKWLYTTSGYYDKTMNGNYFDVIHHKNKEQNKDPEVYINYLNILLTFLKISDNLSLFFHRFHNENKIVCENKNILELKEEFKEHLNYKDFGYLPKEKVYNFISDKNLLIISPFSPLIKQQIESKNCKKIYENFPDIKNVICYQNIYTFFNNGPHNNILETVEILFNDIKQKIDINSFDSVLISCGAYSCLFAEKFYNLENKNVCIVGGELHDFFGIMNNRNRNNITINQEYWIQNIPDEYKPEGYMKIEDGCYW